MEPRKADSKMQNYEEGQSELVKVTKNTNERALVRVCIPKTRKTHSEVDVTS